MRKKIILIVATILTISITVVVIFNKNKKNDTTSPSIETQYQEVDKIQNTNSEPEEAEFCTADVMKCPDGSYVSREQPDCKFKQCPTTIFETK